MQLSKTNQVDLIDCISAKQLLHALNTLQQISQQNEQNQVQLSFSQESNSLFNTSNNNKCKQAKMDFQIYMAMKNKNIKPGQISKLRKASQKISQNCLQKKRSKKDNENYNDNSKSVRKSSTPLKQNTILRINQNTKPNVPHSKQKSCQSINISKNKHQSKSMNRKSLSPIGAVQHQKQIVCNQKKQVYPTKSLTPKQSKSFSNNSGLRRPRQKQNKENQVSYQQNNIQKQQTTPAKIQVSEKSKKIMIEREKRGKAYIPIQERTNQLIKQKQEKIAKIQRANLALKQFQQRQCTFKPCINTYSKLHNNSCINNVNGHHNCHGNSPCISIGAISNNAKNKQCKANGNQNHHRVRTMGDEAICQSSFDISLNQGNNHNISYPNNNQNSINTIHQSYQKEKQKSQASVSLSKNSKTERIVSEQNSMNSFKNNSHVNINYYQNESQLRRVQKSRDKERERQKPKNQKFNILLDLIN